ncbi:MAG: hypothetical protein V4478_00675 [Patescibacteria group bacterium]
MEQHLAQKEEINVTGLPKTLGCYVAACFNSNYIICFIGDDRTAFTIQSFERVPAIEETDENMIFVDAALGISAEPVFLVLKASADTKYETSDTFYLTSAKMYKGSTASLRQQYEKITAPWRTAPAV